MAYHLRSRRSQHRNHGIRLPDAAARPRSTPLYEFGVRELGLEGAWQRNYRYAPEAAHEHEIERVQADEGPARRGYRARARQHGRAPLQASDQRDGGQATAV